MPDSAIVSGSFEENMTPEEQVERPRRGTEGIIRDEDLLERLRARAREGRPLRVEQGLSGCARHHISATPWA
jgi:hypothetical protein